MDSDSDERFRERLRDVCGLFVTVIKSKIYLLHQTVKEFLIRPESTASLSTGLQWKQSFAMSESHRILGEVCLWHLQFPEVLQMPTNLSNHDYLQGPRKVYDFLQYSGYFFADHLLAPGVEVDESMTKAMLAICHGCSRYRPYWLQAMGFRVWWYHFSEPSRQMAYDITRDNRITLLMVACYLGFAPAIDMLIAAGCDIHAKDKAGRTALTWAAARGHYDAVKALLGYQRGWVIAAGWPNFWNLLAKARFLDVQDNTGRTPLMWAKLHGWGSIVQLLLDKGAMMTGPADDRRVLKRDAELQGSSSAQFRTASMS
jgi:hypothetical protein